MMPSLASPEFPISDLNILLVTSQAKDSIWKKHYKRHHPPDTLMIYHQACQALSSNVFVLPIDEYLKEVTGSSFHLKDNNIVVNISGGLTDIELTSIIPSAAAHIAAPVFPAGTKSLVTTHDKLLCKHLAQNSGLKVSQTVTSFGNKIISKKLIEKPICGGDSIGISTIDAGSVLDCPKTGHFIEEFVNGFDATIHLLRNEDEQSYSILDHLIAGSGGDDWFDLDSKNESNRIYGQNKIQSLRERHNEGISKEFKMAIERLLNVSGQPFIARIDFRQVVKGREVGIEDCIFLELNVAPTISHANDWLDGVTRTFHDVPQLEHFKSLTIHPAARSLGFLIWRFYVQSLSIAGNRSVRSTNLPK